MPRPTRWGGVIPPASLRVVPLAGLVVLVVACEPSSTDPGGGDARLEVEPRTAHLAEIGDSLHFRAFAVLDGGRRASVEPAWVSEPRTIADVRPDGWVTARGLGVAVIRAVHEADTASALLRVDPDTVPPTLRDVFARPGKVVLSLAPVRVELTAEFVDRGSGVESALAIFDGPLGAGITGLVVMELEREARLEDGLALAVYRGAFEIPGLTGVGIWTLDALKATDRSGNVRQWGADDLEAANLSVVVEATLGG
ncbi:MAG: hypothetical protein R3304_01115 [Longimicrobiales bacterium]|nr:hypothetical protein [Longimicrobiales bacterium]